MLAIRSHGRKHIEILKLLSRNHYSVIDRNHAIPVFEFLDYQDVTFAIPRKVGFSMLFAYGSLSWAKNSVGDLIDMIMQCVEVSHWSLSFVFRKLTTDVPGAGFHPLRRSSTYGMSASYLFLESCLTLPQDAFKDNFLVQFWPESLASNRIAITRPRVYLNDFETAVYFPPDVPSEKRLCVGLPSGDSFPLERYSRPKPAELLSDKPYDPFTLDVWQLAISFVDLTVCLGSAFMSAGAELTCPCRLRFHRSTASWKPCAPPMLYRGRVRVKH